MIAWLSRLRWRFFGPPAMQCVFCAERVTIWKRVIPYGGTMWLCECSFCHAGGYGTDGFWWTYG
jgi:hypothetical protein